MARVFMLAAATVLLVSTPVPTNPHGSPASPSERMVLMMSLLGIVEVELVALLVCMAMIALKFQEGHSNTLK